MSRKNLWLVIATITIITAGLIFGYSQKISNDTNNAQTIKIGYRAHDGYAPLFVGIEKGIFKKYDIDVETFRFDSTNQLVEALLAGKIDASLGGVNIPLVMKTEEKSPNFLKIFTTYTETEKTPVTCVIVNKNSTAQSMADLKGKKISITAGSTPLMLFRAILKKWNINPEQINGSSISSDLQLAALESGQFDAALVLEPLATIGTAKQISRNLDCAIWAKYIFPNVPIAASVVINEFAKQNIEITDKLIATTNEAIDFINNPINRTELNLILTKYTPLDSDIVAKLNVTTFSKLTDIKTELLKKERDFLLQEGELKTSINTDNLLYQKL